MISRSEIEAARDGMRPYADMPWLCRDAEGEIAIFESAGFGQIPSEVFASIDDYLAAVPVILEALTERSHFVFDYAGGWLDRSKPYLLISEPLPLASRRDLSGFPTAICAAIKFKEIRELRIDEHFSKTNV